MPRNIDTMAVLTSTGHDSMYASVRYDTMLALSLL